MAWLHLAIAIAGEIVGTTALKASAGFTRPAATVLALASYGIAFYFLALALRTIPVGMAYAIWSGAGVAAISFIGWVLFGQRLDAAAWVGIALILAGVIVLKTVSASGAS